MTAARNFLRKTEGARKSERRPRFVSGGRASRDRSDRVSELRRRVERNGARVGEARFLGVRLRFDVEVVENLDVVAEKSDGAEDQVVRFSPRHVGDALDDGRAEPRIGGGA